MANSFTDWESTCLAHHGIKGQKWGVRRYQNPDGTLTELGKRHEQKKTYKELKKFGKTLSGEGYENTIYSKGRDIISKKAEVQLSRLGRMKRRDEIAYLQGKKRYDESKTTEYGAAKEKLVNDLIGKYGKKKIRTSGTSSSSARRALHLMISGITDDIAYGKDYGKFADKYSQKNGKSASSKAVKKSSGSVNLSKRQKALEQTWKDAVKTMNEANRRRQQAKFDFGGGKASKEYERASAAALKAFSDFTASMTERQKEQYHDRYLR